MASKRVLLSVGALILALVAGLASYSYLHDVQSRAYHNAKLVKVYTVSGPIPKGTTGTAVISKGLVKRGQIPQQFLPSDAVTDLASIRNDVTATNLAPGQILSSSLFQTPAEAAATSTPAQAIPKGDVAITVAVDAVHGVAGLIRPGDQVDILVQTTTGTEQFLYQNVDVLAVGTSMANGVTTTGAANTTSSTAPSSAGAGLITFAVPANAAQHIALAQSGGATGSLYLALVPPGNNATAEPAINEASLIPASVTP